MALNFTNNAGVTSPLSERHSPVLPFVQDGLINGQVLTLVPDQNMDGSINIISYSVQ